MGRLAMGRHPSLRVVPGDTVVLSSHTIPGNEETVHRVINRLFQKGANVIYHPVAPVHVSGHASQEEQKMLISILNPKFFVPIHGELRHLKQHAMLAEEVGIPEKNIAVVENGYVLRFSQDSMEIGERVPGGYVYVDGTLVGDAVSPQTLQDRETLAVSGVCNVVFAYDRLRGKPVNQPRVSMIGVAAEDTVDEVVKQIKALVRQTVQELPQNAPPDEAEKVVKRRVSDFFYKRFRNRPELLVVAMPT
jgi:ribonuclease J